VSATSEAWQDADHSHGAVDIPGEGPGGLSPTPSRVYEAEAVDSEGFSMTIQKTRWKSARRKFAKSGVLDHRFQYTEYNALGFSQADLQGKPK
jgi:hypothetical protein